MEEKQQPELIVPKEFNSTSTRYYALAEETIIELSESGKKKWGFKDVTYGEATIDIWNEEKSYRLIKLRADDEPYSTGNLPKILVTDLMQYNYAFKFPTHTEIEELLKTKPLGARINLCKVKLLTLILKAIQFSGDKFICCRTRRHRRYLQCYS